MSLQHRYLLDTNIISDLMQNPQGKVAKQIAQVSEDTSYSQIWCTTNQAASCF